MGIAIPRPAMRAREARIIRARLAFFDKRFAELRATLDIREASQAAFNEAKALPFDRNGRAKGKR